MEDSPFKMWVTDGEGVSAWIKVFFKETLQITKMKYRNRENPGERTKAMKLNFADGSFEEFSFKNIEASTTVTFSKPK